MGDAPVLAVARGLGAAGAGARPPGAAPAGASDSVAREIALGASAALAGAAGAILPACERASARILSSLAAMAAFHCWGAAAASFLIECASGATSRGDDARGGTPPSRLVVMLHVRVHAVAVPPAQCCCMHVRTPPTRKSARAPRTPSPPKRVCRTRPHRAPLRCLIRSNEFAAPASRTRLCAPRVGELASAAVAAAAAARQAKSVRRAARAAQQRGAAAQALARPPAPSALPQHRANASACAPAWAPACCCSSVRAARCCRRLCCLLLLLLLSCRGSASRAGAAATRGRVRVCESLLACAHGVRWTRRVQPCATRRRQQRRHATAAGPHGRLRTLPMMCSTVTKKMKPRLITITTTWVATATTAISRRVAGRPGGPAAREKHPSLPDHSVAPAGSSGRASRRCKSSSRCP